MNPLPAAAMLTLSALLVLAQSAGAEPLIGVSHEGPGCTINVDGNCPASGTCTLAVQSYCPGHCATTLYHADCYSTGSCTVNVYWAFCSGSCAVNAYYAQCRPGASCAVNLGYCEGSCLVNIDFCRV